MFAKQVGAGTYRESVLIDKNLILQGEAQATTILDGQGLANVRIVSSGKRVTIMSEKTKLPFCPLGVFARKRVGD